MKLNFSSFLFQFFFYVAILISFLGESKAGMGVRGMEETRNNEDVFHFLFSKLGNWIKCKVQNNAEKETSFI